MLLVGCGSSASAGRIAFGTGYDRQFKLQHPATVFRAGDTFAWVATLREQVSAPALTLTLRRAEPGCPQGVEVGSSTLRVDAKRYRTVGKEGPVSSLAADGVTVPGRYTMAVSSDGTELASGRFRLVGGPGAGSIQFGRGYTRSSDGTLTIHLPQTSFGSRDRVAWVATFWTRSGSRTLRLVVDRLAGCRLSPVLSAPKVRTNPTATQFANSVAVSTLKALNVSAPGIYVMRYERDDIILASGRFELRR